MRNQLAKTSLLVAILTVGCKSQPVTVTPPGPTDSAVSLAFNGLPSGSVVAGVPVVATLSPRDTDGDVIADFAGSVTFTSSDGNAVLPGSYSFTSDDSGSKSVSVIFKTAGTQTLKATSGALTTGDISITVVAADANTLTAQAPATVVSDANFSVTLDARDAFGNAASGYRGTLHFTSTDPNANVPANYTFTALDAGHVVVPGFTMGRVSTNASVTAADIGTASLTATTGSVSVSAGLAKSLDLTLNGNSWAAGTSNPLTVTVRDRYGAVATSFRGTVTVNLQNPNSAPATYVFTQADAGQHTFSAVSACTVGNHNLQLVSAGLTAPTPVNIAVTAGPLTNLVLNQNTIDPPGPGEAVSFVITKADSCNNPVSGDAGTVHFSSPAGNLVGGSTAHLPQDQPFGLNTNQLVVSATWDEAGQYNFRAASTTNSALVGQLNNIGVHSISALSITGSDVLSFSCGILDDSLVKCWGVDVPDNGSSGNLGLGDTQARGAPASTMGPQLPPLDLNVNGSIAGISAGGGHACVVTADGNVLCWGNNNHGQLGTGDTNSHGDGQPGHGMGTDLPFVALPTGRTAVEVSAASYHTCAILDDGNVTCWGYNGEGELGVGDANSRGASLATVGNNLAAIDFGNGATAVHLSSQTQVTCAILNNGSVKCWGRNPDGELGYNGTTNVGDSNATGHTVAGAPALALGSGRTATALTSGFYHSCALLDDGSVKCWGYGGSGQLGQNATATINPLDPSMAPIALGGTATALAAMEQSTCALLSDGTVKCWGKNNVGQLGQGNATYYGSSTDSATEMSALTAINLGTGRTATMIAAGSNHACAVLDNGHLRCWGYNGYTDVDLGNGFTGSVGTGPGQMGDALKPTALW